MKKLVLVLAVILVASPVFAAVTLTENAKTGTTVTVGYNRTTDIGLPRAFGLVLQATGGTITSVTAAKTGESTSAARGYGIFPGTITIVDGNVTNYGTPVEPTALPGGPSALGSSRVVVALGSLYGVDTDKPADSGMLFTVVCSAGTTSLNVSEEDTYRAGVVDVNGVALTVANLVVTFADPETITGTPVVAKTTAAPAIAGRVNKVRAESFTASGVASSLGHTLEYQFNWGDGSALVWGAATQTHTFTTATTAAWTTNVTVQARCAADTAITSAVSAAITETGEALSSAATEYTKWGTYGRPNCWGYKKQCRGDADGALTLTKPVMTPDLTCFKLGYNKTPSAVMATLCAGSLPAICADFDHKDTLTKPVMTPDLNVFKAYYNKAATSVPLCDALPASGTGPYNFWTN